MIHPVLLPQKLQTYITSFGITWCEIGLASELVEFTSWLNSQDIKYTTDFNNQHNTFKCIFADTEILPISENTNESYKYLVVIPTKINF